MVKRAGAHHARLERDEQLRLAEHLLSICLIGFCLKIAILFIFKNFFSSFLFLYPFLVQTCEYYSVYVQKLRILLLLYEFYRFFFKFIHF
jgi:hypothetical protein